MRLRRHCNQLLRQWTHRNPLNMDAYPPDYIAHNLPLVVLSGLGDESRLESNPSAHRLLQVNGTPIDSEIPTVTGERAEQLLQEFLKTDASDAPWNSRPAKSRGNLTGFRVRAVGRVGQTPLHR